MELIGTVVSSVIVLIADKCRDTAAERLKEGGLTEQTVRGLIEREIHEVKSKLEGIAGTDLKTAVDVFETGFKFLFDAFDAESLRGATEATETSKALEVDSPSSTTISLADGMINIDLTKLDEKAKRAISNARDRFKMARKHATAASNNEALSPFERITALRYRVMATILEALDNPADALPECEQCLTKLHSLPAVRGSFKDELNRSLLNKKERKEIISTVCQINHVIYDVTQSADKDVHLWKWPFVNTGEDKIDPLRDARITEVLHEQGMEHCCVTPWSFGQEGEEDHKVKLPWRIASNTEGDFIVADNKDRNVKVFDYRGRFLHAFRPPNDGVVTEVQIYDVATDGEDNICVLFGREKPGAQKREFYGVYVRSVAADQHRVFSLREELMPWSWYLSSMTVNSNNKVLVRGRLSDAKHAIDVYSTEGQFVRTFGAGKLKNPSAITSANDGTVMVQDEHKGSRYVRMFSEQGDHLFKVKVNESFSFSDVVFDHVREQIIVAGQEAGKHRLRMLVYTKDGRTFVRGIELDVDPGNASFITPSDAFIDAEHDYKVLVF